MKKIVNFFKQLRLSKVLTALLVGILLLTNVACSASDVRNAATDNLPVQVGGNNNPYKGGGSDTVNHRMGDPKLNVENKRAALPEGTLLATNPARVDSDEMLYPAEGAPKSKKPTLGTREQETLAKEIDQFPKKPQPVVDRNDPNTRILEKVGENFKQSSGFLKDKTDEAFHRPEMQANPATDPMNK
ncbi:MAG: DUF6658 family protein [Leptolyngbyaceae cyanobacterium bins.59]|nr:DUF6658 family protein [Leptolyngbyaceae cyanobacterium bins.59]